MEISNEMDKIGTDFHSYYLDQIQCVVGNKYKGLIMCR